MKLLTILFLILIYSCSPKVLSETTSTSRTNRSELSYLPFAIIENDTTTFDINQKIGKIEIKDSGLSTNCDFMDVKSLAKKEALKMGGNCYVITEHREPNKWSTCHRIKADVYFIDNPEAYEYEIEWNEKRRLKIEDFKGSTNKRPFTAATASSFRYSITTKTGYSKNYTIKATTFFDCETSYFKRTERNSAVLAHEQIHFDISELYARKFLIRMEKEAKNINEALAIHRNILDEISKELQLKQDEYDSEVYPDPSKQKEWNNWIKHELNNTNLYKDKTIHIKNK